MPKIQECGILFRGYAKEKEAVDEVVDRLYLSVCRAIGLGFRRVTVLVPRDKDCGVTANAIALKVSHLGPGGVFVVSPLGNENSDVLNRGLLHLRAQGRKYAFIMSNKAIEYLTTKNVDKMLLAFETGAFAVGLAVRDESVSEEEDDVYRGVLEGRLSNIFCAWDIRVLNAGDDFDSEIGVEEIAPIIRIIRAYGGRVAPIFPVDHGGLSISPFRAEHWKEIFSKKMERQLKEAKRTGGSFELIKGHILRGYPE